MIILLLILLLFASPAEAYKFASGSYTGNATDDRTIDISDTTTPSVADFQPDAVIIRCNSTGGTVWLTSAMPGDATLSFGSNGAAVANKIQSFVSNGFVIGTHADVNANTITCYYVALAADSRNDLAVGSYAANGADDRSIDISDTSVGSVPDFQPELVIIQRGATTTNSARFRVAAMAGDVSCTFIAAICEANMIQAMEATGFQVGSGTNVNGTTATVYYLAIKAVSGNTAGGTYTGDNADGRDIDISDTSSGSADFQPTFAFVKGNATEATYFRFQDHSGDSSIILAGTANQANRIQDFLTNGFDVGTSSSVNGGSTTYYYYAIKEEPVSARKRVQTIIIE